MDKERLTEIAKEIYDILCKKKCTIGQATEILRQVECVLSVAPIVQNNDVSKKMFICSD